MESVLYLGDDWSEHHHDVELVDDDGRVLARRKVSNDAGGLQSVHELIAEHLPGDDLAQADAVQVRVGIETADGPWPAALAAAGYLVYPINPLQVSRYRQRHSTSGAKSDPGDAHVLAEIVRLDAAHHQLMAADSALSQQLRILTRAHKQLIWARQQQRQVLRATLRLYYPAAVALWNASFDTDAVAILTAAPTPQQGRALTRARIKALLVKAGRQRYLASKTEQIYQQLHSDQWLAVDDTVAHAYGTTVSAGIAVIAELSRQIQALEAQVVAGFGQHPDAEIYLSQPGMGPILGARVLSEFGDAAQRYTDRDARRNYAGTSPVTRRSGMKIHIQARYARNDRLTDALYLQAEHALRTSPGAKAYYQARRDRGAGHAHAVRAVANRLVGVLHGCLAHRTRYDETTAWAAHTTSAQHAA